MIRTHTPAHTPLQYAFYSSTSSKVLTRPKAFYAPVKDRTNLTVLVAAHVNKIISATGISGNLVATGVEFSYGDFPHVVNATKEVILCSGSVRYI